MTETRDLLREAVGSYEPRGDEETVLRRVERRRRSRRVASGAVALGLFAAMGWLAWSGVGPMGGTPASADRPNFVLSAFDIDSHVDPETGEVVPGQVDVRFTARWSSDEYPGTHRCTVRIASLDGNRIGARSIEVSSLFPRASLTTVVSVRGSISGGSVTGSCEAERLDAAVAAEVSGERFAYVITDLLIAYEVDVPEGDRIGAQACTSAVWNALGDVLGSTEFVIRPTTETLYAGLGVDDATARSDGAAATVTCEPYVQPNMFPVPEPPNVSPLDARDHR